MTNRGKTSKPTSPSAPTGRRWTLRAGIRAPAARRPTRAAAAPSPATRARIPSRSRSPGRDDDPMNRLWRRPVPQPAGPRRQPVQVQRHRAGAPDLRRHERRHAGAGRPSVRTSAERVRRAGSPGPPLENVGGRRRRRNARLAHRDLPDGRHPDGAQDRRPDHASARRPAGEPDCSAATPTTRRARSSRPSTTAASRGTAENSSRAAPWWNTATKQCPAARRSSSPTPTWASDLGVNSKLNPWRCVPTAPGALDGPGRRRHGRRDQELLEHPAQLVPERRLPRRRQLRRQAATR